MESKINFIREKIIKLKQDAELVNLLISIISGYVFYEIGKKQQPMINNTELFFFSAMITIVIASFLSIRKIRKQVELNKDTIYKIVELGDRRLQAKSLNSLRLSKYVNMTLNKDQVARAWKDLCFDIDTEYKAINYEHDDSAQDVFWSNTGLDIQNFKSKYMRARMTKIFVIDKPSELIGLKNVISRQLEWNIKILVITSEKAREARGLCDLTHGKSLDFSIVNNDVLFVWDLDDKRHCRSGKVSIDTRDIIDHREVFSEIEQESILITHIGAIDKLINELGKTDEAEIIKKEAKA